MASISVVDFANFGLDIKTGDSVSDDALKTLGTEVKCALSTFGFCYLKNHGVDEMLINDFMRVSREFFELPDGIKRKYGMNAEVKAGWVGFGHETLNPARPADLKESFTYYVPAYKDYSMPSVANFEALRGCQLSKTNTCIIFTCMKKNNNFSKETGYS